MLLSVGAESPSTSAGNFLFLLAQSRACVPLPPGLQCQQHVSKVLNALQPHLFLQGRSPTIEVPDDEAMHKYWHTLGGCPPLSARLHYVYVQYLETTESILLQ